MQALLETFPVVSKIPVLWGDMDSFQHVNNVIYFRYFESARIQYFDTLGWNLLFSIGLIHLMISQFFKSQRNSFFN